jgi:hypothetical protein
VTKASQFALAVFLLLLTAGAVRDLSRLSPAATWWRADDLPEFYCAGRVVTQHQDPYLAGPLRSCEHSVKTGGLWNNPSYVVAAPQPPYDFVPYALLSRANFASAKIFAAALTCAAVLVTAFALADLGIPLVAALAALFMADAFTGLFSAQIYPFAVMIVALGAVALRRRRDPAAGILGALTLIEPQIGVATVIVLALFVPRARVALAVTILVLAAIGVAAVSGAAFSQWPTVVAQLASAETRFWDQYSLTSVLATAGLPAKLALLVGALSSIVMIVLAAVVATRLVDTSRRREFFAFVPAAFALVGGTFVHLDGVAASLPLALACVAIWPRPATRWAPMVPILLLAVPWLFSQQWKALFFACALVAAALLATFRIAIRPAIALFLAAAVGLWLIALHTPQPLKVLAIAMPSGNMLASDWTLSTAADPLRELAKIPTWIGLLGLVILCLRLASLRRPLPGNAT